MQFNSWFSMCVDGYRYDSYKSKFFLFLAFLTVLQIVIVILFNFIFGKSCFISVGSVYINLYHLHLIPHLHGQSLQFLVSQHFHIFFIWEHSGICSLLCGWPNQAVSQRCNIQLIEVKDTFDCVLSITVFCFGQK